MNDSSGFALRFISGKYQGGEFPLARDAEIIIGRGGELDIVLVEDMVSRKHAKLNTTDDKIVIQDLGSTNGTFVNGEKIKRARLKEGDRVLIGTSILKLISSAAPAAQSGAEANDALQAIAKERGNDAATSMSGSLSEVGLPDLLQLFSTSRKSGVLAVTNTEDSGRIYLRNGQIYYATWNDLEEIGPMKAIFRMIGWEEGEFRLGPASDEEFMLEIEDPPDQLIMEAVRQLDEYRTIESALPELEDMLSVNKPLRPPLGQLSKEELEVFQLAFNNGFFQSVLDESPYSDLQTARVVKKLIEGEYLRV